MGFWSVIMIALGLAMDAFAVSICKGLAAGKATFAQAVSAGLWFGGFQALMPVIGFFLGSRFRSFIASVDHWIAFGLLLWIGISTLKEAYEDEEYSAGFTPKDMIPPAVATSIDALAAGVTFSVLDAGLWTTVTAIGVITAVLSFIGVKAGAHLGEKNRKRAQIFGGAVLILMGCQILLDHLGIL